MSKTLDGVIKDAIPANSGPIVNVGECAIVAGRVDNGNLKTMALNANTRQLLQGSTATEGVIPGIHTLTLGQYVLPGYGWNNVLGEFQLFYRALDDMELVARMYQTANYVR